MRAETGRAPLADINVTPLVDVMLVLLIIFMVTAPLLEQSINVTLPKAATGRQLSGSGLTITITREHLVYFNGEPVTLAGLKRALLGTPHDQSILIRADRSAYVSRLVELWDLCRGTGFHEIHIATLNE